MHPNTRIFSKVLVRSPSKALGIAWWYITRRRVRALGRLRAAAAGLPVHYRIWLDLYQSSPTSETEMALHEDDDVDSSHLAVHLHLSADDSPDLARRALQSIFDQAGQRWAIYVTCGTGKVDWLADDPRINLLRNAVPTRAKGLVQVAALTRASHVIPLSCDSALTGGALLAFAQVITKDSAAQRVLFYADQDEWDAKGKRSTPWFKPAWDEDLFLVQDYISAACAIPTAALSRCAVEEDCADSSAVYALLVQLLVGPEPLSARRVYYVAVTTPAGSWSMPCPTRRKLVGKIAQNRIGGHVTSGPYGTLVLHRSLPEPPPRVSVIVPTRDRLDLLETCVEGLLAATDYPDLELVIADNASVEPATLAYLERCCKDPRVIVVRWPNPFNYSAINNFAIAKATGSYVCLLNNDTEVFEPNWLRDLVVQAVRPEVGAVGARLLYPDHSIQHAGVVVGLGNAAGHAHRGLPDGEPGYFAQALIARGSTAVTGACLVVAKAKFEEVGGLDETGLAIAYNDIDLCLKLRRAGYRNIYEPAAVLIHHESKSRGLDFAPEHLARYKRELAIFQERWQTKGFRDPFHHPALDIGSEEYRLSLIQS